MAGFNQGTQAGLPNSRVRYYAELFTSIIRDNLNLYWQARKFKIPPASDAPVVPLISEPQTYSTRLEEIMNWENFKRSPAKDEDVERAVSKLGVEAGVTVEALLRKFAAKHGSAHDVRNVYVTDLFMRADGSVNLNFMLVENAPISCFDPSGLIPGWAAYKFWFACGFPVNSESDYIGTDGKSEVRTLR